VEALKNERMGPPGPCSSRSGSRYSMSRTCGPRDIISLVIPRLGDNMDYSANIGSHPVDESMVKKKDGDMT
jgi:hypothetical protein